MQDLTSKDDAVGDSSPIQEPLRHVEDDGRVEERYKDHLELSTLRSRGYAHPPIE